MRKAERVSGSSVAGESRTTPKLRELYKWFVRRDARGGSHAFEAMVDFLADATRLHPLREEARHEDLCGEPMRLAREWIEPWLLADALEDDLGHVMERDANAMNEGFGQFLTPMNLARMNVRMLLGDESTPPEGEVRRVLDPACGTGRFPMVAMAHTAPFDDGRYVFCAIDVDLRMVRTTMLNLWLTNWWRRAHGWKAAPFRVVWANALAVDFTKPEAWAHANQWDPPHWRELPTRTRPGPVTAKPAAEAAAKPGYFAVATEPAGHVTVQDAGARRVDAAAVAGLAPIVKKETRQAALDLFGGSL